MTVWNGDRINGHKVETTFSATGWARQDDGSLVVDQGDTRADGLPEISRHRLAHDRWCGGWRVQDQNQHERQKSGLHPDYAQECQETDGKQDDSGLDDETPGDQHDRRRCPNVKRFIQMDRRFELNRTRRRAKSPAAAAGPP
jgi:hypothetical protein